MPFPRPVDATDYCGIYSGEKVDKSQVFEVFRRAATAPMIAEVRSTWNSGGPRSSISAVAMRSLREIVELTAPRNTSADGRPDHRKSSPSCTREQHQLLGRWGQSWPAPSTWARIQALEPLYAVPKQKTCRPGLSLCLNISNVESCRKSHFPEIA